MLKTALEQAAQRLPGCEAAALVGQDGMVVEHWARDGGPSMEVLAAELTPLLRSVDSLSKSSKGGSLREILVRLDSWSCFIQPVHGDIFLVFVAAQDTIPGRLRYEAVRTSAMVEADLK